MMHRVIISVGSNIEPEKNIAKSREILAEETSLLGEATVIKTLPVGYQDQPDFLNSAFYLETPLEKDDFNAYLKTVEQQLGRVKGSIKSGPRTIDLDIIIWDGEVVHDDYYDKDYVIRPLQELITKLQINID